MTATYCHDGNTLGHGHDGHAFEATEARCGRGTHTFDPAAWLAAWTANGCGYYLSSSGLGLGWADVQDRHLRNRMLEELNTRDRVAEVAEHIDSLRYGRELAA